MTPARSFARKLGWFVFPYVLLAAAALAFLQRSGELESVRRVAARQSRGEPFLYGVALSDRAYRLKVEAARMIRPDVLAIGPSRMNQWRSAMFAPHRFYNAGNCIYVQRDFRRVLEELDAELPRVVLFSVDFYTFNPAWDKWFDYVSREDLAPWGTRERTVLVRRFAETLLANPLLVLRRARDPIYGQPAVGLRAIELGNGFRIDGSMQYGTALTKSEPPDTVESVVGRVQRSEAPFMASPVLDDERRRELARFVELARSKGIALVGVTMPYDPAVVRALNESPGHGSWREFQDNAFGEWLRGLGVVYFNFTRLETFGGRPDEFVDPFHPSETAYLRMLLNMLSTPAFRHLLPELRPQPLMHRLRSASALEVFRNEF